MYSENLCLSVCLSLCMSVCLFFSVGILITSSMYLTETPVKQKMKLDPLFIRVLPPLSFSFIKKLSFWSITI